MNENQYSSFAELWAMANEIAANGKVLSSNAMFMIFNALKKYPFEIVKQALETHITSNQFAPTVAGIIEIIIEGTGNKHLAPAEAWGGFPKESHESKMVTTEMLKAWDVACDLYERKQFFAAEKAFLAAYTREVSESNMLGRVPKYQLSRGTNEAQLKTVVEDALAKGLLSQDYAQSILQSLPAPATGVIAGYLSGKTVDTKGLSGVGRSCLTEIMKSFDERDAQIELERKQAREAEIKRRDDMINAAMMELPPEEQTAFKQANLERYGNEVLH